MKRVLLVLLVIVLAAGGCLAQGGAAAGGKEKKDLSKARWHGIIVRHSAENSTFDVRKGGIQKTVVFDSSTAWTDHNNPADRSAFKDGADIIAFGTWDEKGRLMARQIDLRKGP